MPRFTVAGEEASRLWPHSSNCCCKVVKSNKSDIIDAEAIAEAVTRPTMRFVEVRTSDQIDVQALHRVRDRLVAQRTRVICQMRAFCLEYGIAMHQGAG